MALGGVQVSNDLIRMRHGTAVCTSACVPVGMTKALFMRDITF